MNQLELAVRPRPKYSKNANRRARRDGLIPAVIYGGQETPQAVLIDQASFIRMLPSVHSTTLFNLDIEGQPESQMAIIREFQRDPVHHEQLIHIDFYRIRKDKPIVVELPIHTVGTPAGVKLGGVLETQLRHVTIRCLPLEIPDHIEIDVSEMDIGQTVHVSDLPVAEGVEIMTSLSQVVLLVAAPTKEEIKEEVAAEAVEGEEAEAKPEAAEEESAASSDKD
jgi:large subunit ribosomal protein L25